MRCPFTSKRRVKLFNLLVNRACANRSLFVERDNFLISCEAYNNMKTQTRYETRLVSPYTLISFFFFTSFQIVLRITSLLRKNELQDEESMIRQNMVCSSSIFNIVAFHAIFSLRKIIYKYLCLENLCTNFCSAFTYKVPFNSHLAAKRFKFPNTVSSFHFHREIEVPALQSL